MFGSLVVVILIYHDCSIDRAPEELFQQLDDNQVTLSTMKASRFVKAFEKEVDYWERTLSLILEVIEMILQVQRQWMYLEVRKVISEFSDMNILYTITCMYM